MAKVFAKLRTIWGKVTLS